MAGGGEGAKIYSYCTLLNNCPGNTGGKGVHCHLTGDSIIVLAEVKN
jgi:hypothetical protein